MPTGRILTAGMEGMKAGAARTPIVGPPIRAAVRAATRSYAESAPKPQTPPATPEAAIERLSATPASAASGLSPKAAIEAATKSAGVTLNGRQTAHIFELVKDGIPADQALKQVIARPQAAAAAGRTTQSATSLPDWMRYLTPDEQAEALKMAERGMSEAVIQRAIQKGRKFNQALGLKTPTKAERKFTKGWGGQRQK